MAATRNYRLIVLSVLTGALWLWAYGPVLAETAERWSSNPNYSHGYLVPGFAGVLLWVRRKSFGVEEPSWWSLPLLALGFALHLAGAYFYYDWFSAASMLPVLAGLVLALGGIRCLAWSWPAIAFLAFMLPLPHKFETALSFPLQRLATAASTYVLQTLGLPAVAEGNVILMHELRIGVVEACNGLGMLVTFFGLTTAVAILIQRRWTDKIIIVLSAIPIALAANVLRIVLTGLMGVAFGAEIADLVFHNLAGYIMTPLALGMLWVEVQILSCLLVEPVNETNVFEMPVVAPPLEKSTLSGHRPELAPRQPA